MKHAQKLSTENYKGVRDFYPEDQYIQRYIFDHMSRTCELFGYEEYNASILEPTELYRTKTSEEIVNEQTYSFTDRGGREVTLRPEMTPTLARMIAARRREIPFPARWYTIENNFRYERPQKGRTREFWQLNADILGSTGIEADAEVIALAHAVLRTLGADERDFEIRVSDRRILNALFDTVGIQEDRRADTTRLLDKRGKIDNFTDALIETLDNSEQAHSLIENIDRTTSSAYLEKLRIMLTNMGVTNMTVDTKITRGLDYYTGMVFEIFDTHTDNHRSMAGGGRYDNLLSLFGDELLPAVGFGLGDVITRDFLETHGLMPKYTPTTELMLAVIDSDAMSHAIRLAQDLRIADIAVAVNFSGKKASDQFRHADKMHIPFIIAIGSQERESGRYTIKELETGREVTVSADRIAEHIFATLD